MDSSISVFELGWFRNNQGHVNSILVYCPPSLPVGLYKRFLHLPLFSCSICKKYSMDSKSTINAQALFTLRLRDLKTRFPHSTSAKLEVDNQIAKLVQLQTVVEELSRWGHLDRADRQQMKEWSYSGVVRISKNRFLDIGNWKYAVLYLLMFRSSLRIGEQCSLPFQNLAEKYASLKLNAKYTNNSVEMMGDCMECILHTSSHTGPIIPDLVRRDRLLAHQIIKKVNEFLDRMLHYVFDGESYTVAELPAPGFVVAAMEGHLNDEHPGSVHPQPYFQSAARGDHNEDFLAMCLQAESHWQKYADFQNRPWFWNSASGEWFYAHEGAQKGWLKYRIVHDRTSHFFCWFHKATGRWFSEIAD